MSCPNLPHPRLHALIALVACSVAIPVLGAGGTMSGSGTSASPYLVEDYADLASIGNSASSRKSTYRIVADIDASASDAADSGRGFAPIVDFYGTIHGGGHAIRGLRQRRPSEIGVSLVQTLEAQGVIDSLGLEGGAIQAADMGAPLVSINEGTITGCWSSDSVSVYGENGGAGGLVANNYGTIANCSASGAVSAFGSINAGAGGLVCMNEGGTIRSSHATGNTWVGNDSSVAGGLVVANDATIDTCYATGDVTSGTMSLAGGLAGRNSGLLRQSCALGSVTSGGYYVGGLVGWAWDGNAQDELVVECFARGLVHATSLAAEVGGLVGRIDSAVIRASASTGAVLSDSGQSQAGGLVGVNSHSRVVDCYSTGSVTGTGGDVDLGGLAGWSNSRIDTSYATGKIVGGGHTFDFLGGLVGVKFDSIVSCYWNVVSTGLGSGTGVNDSGDSGTGLSTAQMASAASFAGWDFSKVWSLAEGDSAPRLRAIAARFLAVESVRGATAFARHPFTWSIRGGIVSVSSSDAVPFEAELRSLDGRRFARSFGSGPLNLRAPSGEVVIATARGRSGTSSVVLSSLK